jgi:quinol monooxygenase YgiN
MTMRALEVSVRMKVRAGQLEGLKKQAAQCVKETRDKDTKTLRYDWFVSSDGTECETREASVDSDSVVEHRVKNVAAATNAVFSKFADDPIVTVCGDASPELMPFAGARMGEAVKWYSFLQGLDS